MKRFKCQETSRLRHELKMSPARLRLRQLAGIERAVQLIDPDKEYPFSFVAFHVTGYAPRNNRSATEIGLRGKSLIQDLAGLAEELTAEQPLPVDPALGVVHDADGLAARFNVSTKTISRWRKRGLIGCWFAEPGERPRIAYTSRSVRIFVGRNRDLIRRGSSFQLMTDDEREAIITRAREIVASGDSTLHAVTQRLADETGRAVETIRYTLRNFDLENPQQALFDKCEQANAVDQNEIIYQAFMEGDSLAAIAARFDKTAADVGRAITNCRLNELCAGPLDYIYNESFDHPNADRDILGARCGAKDGASEEDATLSRVPSGLPAYLQALYRTPLLSPAEEALLFRQMNYRMHRAELLRRKLAARPEKANTSDVAAVDTEIDMAIVLRKQITQANLRLVVSIAKRHLASNSGAALFELVSDGNVSLMRAVDKFDYARGFKFSTYATWAIKRGFARSLPEDYVRRDRFRTGHDEFLAAARDHRPETLPIESASKSAMEQTIADGLSALSQRERRIVERRFGLSGRGSTDTLDDISREIGLSKERIRQIERQALANLREHIGDRGVELLAG